MRISENEIDVEKPGEINNAGDALDVVQQKTECVYQPVALFTYIELSTSLLTTIIGFLRIQIFSHRHSGRQCRRDELVDLGQRSRRVDKQKNMPVTIVIGFIKC